MLRNATELPAQFKWRVLNPPAKETCSISFSPRHGTVDSCGNMAIKVTFTPLTAVRFELLCIAEVVGMPEPIGFLLTSLARGLILSFVGITDEEAAEVRRLHDRHEEPDIKTVRGCLFERVGSVCARSSVRVCMRVCVCVCVCSARLLRCVGMSWWAPTSTQPPSSSVVGFSNETQCEVFQSIRTCGWLVLRAAGSLLLLLSD